MKFASAVLLVLLSSNGLALAQPSPPSNPTTGPTVPNVAPAPNGVPSIGYGPGVNPNNRQDLSGRNNPQDLTRPGATNSQDLRR